MHAHARLRRERHTHRDMREIVVEHGVEIPLDARKREISEPIMAFVDSLPPDWRTLVYDFGPEAHMLYEESTPEFSNQRRMTATEARKILTRRP
jgi:hypothetical protein